MRYCLKVRDDEQSVMKSGRVFQARGPATANARSPIVVGRVTGTSRADEDRVRNMVRDRVRVRGRCSAVQLAYDRFFGIAALNRDNLIVNIAG